MLAIHATAGMKQKVLDLLTRGAQYLASIIAWKAFVRTTRPRFYGLVLRRIYVGEVTRLAGSSSLDDLNRPGTFWPKTCNPYI